MQQNSSLCVYVWNEMCLVLITANCNSYISLTSQRKLCYKPPGLHTDDSTNCWLLHDFLLFNRLDHTVYGLDNTDSKCFDTMSVCVGDYSIRSNYLVHVWQWWSLTATQTTYIKAPSTFCFDAKSNDMWMGMCASCLRANYINLYPDLIMVSLFNWMHLDFVMVVSTNISMDQSASKNASAASGEGGRVVSL